MYMNGFTLSVAVVNT